MARSVTIAAFVALALTACGDSVVRRPLTLSVGNLSGRAAKLIVKLFPASQRLSCAGIGVANVAELEAPFTQTWERSVSPSNRTIALPEIDEERVVIAVHTEDDTGMTIQFVCEEVDYTALESPEVEIQLSSRM